MFLPLIAASETLSRSWQTVAAVCLGQSHTGSLSRSLGRRRSCGASGWLATRCHDHFPQIPATVKSPSSIPSARQSCLPPFRRRATGFAAFKASGTTIFVDSGLGTMDNSAGVEKPKAMVAGRG